MTLHAHKEGVGFSIELTALPLDGRLVALLPTRTTTARNSRTIQLLLGPSEGPLFVEWIAAMYYLCSLTHSQWVARFVFWRVKKAAFRGRWPTAFRSLNVHIV
jgi:hypothetical protein